MSCYSHVRKMNIVRIVGSQICPLKYAYHSNSNPISCWTVIVPSPSLRRKPLRITSKLAKHQFGNSCANSPSRHSI